jgi:Ribbon-helix-helix protein, copG family
MKVTTVRFSEELWAAVSAEAARAGVSASQFIREAALARAAGAAGARGEVVFDSYAATVGEVERAPELERPPELEPDRQRAIQSALSALTRALSGTARDDAEALRAESRQARRTSEQRRAARERSRRST